MNFRCASAYSISYDVNKPGDANNLLTSSSSVSTPTAGQFVTTTYNINFNAGGTTVT